MTFSKVWPVILVLLTGCGGAEASRKSHAAPASAVWKLENPRTVDGADCEVLGNPVVKTENGVTALIFDGKSDGVFVPRNPLIGWQQFTIEVLIKPDGSGDEAQRFIHIEDSAGRRAMVETRVTRDGHWALDTYLRTDAERNRTLFDFAKLHATDKWYWVALVYDGKAMSSYVDGEKELEGPVDFLPMIDGQISVGVRQNRVYWYKGAISEIRFHPKALRPAELQHAPK
ncbi:MAG: LamG domain-containing protein [Nibricoccus sp.]